MAETMSSLIVRRVKVNRQRTPQQALDATGRQQYTDHRPPHPDRWQYIVDREVVKLMPRGEGEEVEICFFNLARYISDEDLAREYELRGLAPDPYAQAAVNEADPAFADEHRNGTHWKGRDGTWYYVAFARWRGKRGVRCNRRDILGWGEFWWFGGVRKQSS
jgi:hypothetical protein